MTTIGKLSPAEMDKIRKLAGEEVYFTTSQVLQVGNVTVPTSTEVTCFGNMGAMKNRTQRQAPSNGKPRVYMTFDLVDQQLSVMTDGKLLLKSTPGNANRKTLGSGTFNPHGGLGGRSSRQ